jgi:hypothetical protein
MSDKKISALTGASTPLAGTEVLPIVQGGATVKVAVSDLTAGRDVSMRNITTTGTNTLGNADTDITNIGAGTIYANGGTSVGINTITPSKTGHSALTLNTNSTGIAMFEFAVSDVLKAYIYGSASSMNIAPSGTNPLIINTGGVDRFTFSGAGIVTMAAYGAGTATFSAAGVISSVSDENWKRKDGAPTNPTEMLGKLQPGYWYYNDQYKDTFGSERQLGFYAQNVNAAIGPEAAPEPESFTVTDDQGIETTQQKPWGYYDRSVLAVVVMALQEALATVKALEVRIQALETKI